MVTLRVWGKALAEGWPGLLLFVALLILASILGDQ
jgi:hypothetical protein